MGADRGAGAASWSCWWRLWAGGDSRRLQRSARVGGQLRLQLGPGRPQPQGAGVPRSVPASHSAVAPVTPALGPAPHHPNLGQLWRCRVPSGKSLGWGLGPRRRRAVSAASPPTWGSRRAEQTPEPAGAAGRSAPPAPRPHGPLRGECHGRGVAPLAGGGPRCRTRDAGSRGGRGVQPRTGFLPTSSESPGRRHTRETPPAGPAALPATPRGAAGGRSQDSAGGAPGAELAAPSAPRRVPHQGGRASATLRAPAVPAWGREAWRRELAGTGQPLPRRSPSSPAAAPGRPHSPAHNRFFKK